MSTRLIGERIKRREDRRLLTGTATFIDDVRLPGMAHAVVLRSQHAKARIRRIDASGALALPGVLAVITHEDLGAANDPMPLLNQDRGFIHPRTHRALAPGQVRFVGEAVALIVAEDRYRAEDALELIDVEYEPASAAVDLLAAALPGAPLVHDDTDSNIACRTVNAHGDVEAAFSRAEIVVKEELRPERGCAQPMETRGVVGQYDASLDHLTVWDTTQAPVSARGLIAAKLGLPEASVTVIAPDVGGGFGVKIMLLYPEELLIPFAARLLRRPVKWIEDRREHFLGSNHERLMVHEVELAATKDGRLLGLRDVFYYDSGAYCPYGPINAECCQAVLPGPYKLPAIRTEYIAVYTNTPIVSPYRGAGQPHGTFVIETMMNRLAEAAGLDPVEVRRRNLVAPADCPYDAGTVFQYGTPLIHRDCDYPAQLDTLLAALDYDGFRCAQPGLRAKGIYKGIGLAFYVEGTGIPPYEGVELRIEPTGHVHVATGYPSQGQGHHTTLIQIVAETLGVEPDKVVVQSGRTDRFAWGVGTFASRAAVVGGSAALKVARRVREKAIERAADKLEVAAADLEIVAGRVQVKGVPGVGVTLAALAAEANPIITLEPGVEPGLRATEYYRPEAACFSSGVHGLTLEVDIETGMARIERYVVVHDCGTMINPMIVEGQILGAVAQGIGGVFYEKLVFDEAGQLLTTTFMDYLIPTAMEVPPIEIHHLDTPSSLNPLGVKGVGEGGVMPVAPAFSAAVEDALAPFGARIRAVPFGPPDLLAMIEGIERA
ncbi:MAG: molybdopterin cofactor-binding domain-containing protein [Alphaproteobacteria bacterium]